MDQDLKERITYLIGYERSEGLVDDLTPEEIAQKLHVPLEEVEEALRRP